MPFELTILSGKGGTGKTSVSAAFARLAPQPVLCDLDVDASNLPLMVQAQEMERHDFVSGQVARLDRAKCRDCGRCLPYCKFDALTETDDGHVHLDTAACEGCGVCAHFCRRGAIVMEPRTCGQWFRSQTDYGPMLHARLNPGEENSGKLISTLRQQAKEVALSMGAGMILSDGPPGIGCPVISSVTGSSAVVCVTEPTASGLHDVQRVLQLAQHFEIPAALIINKFGLNAEIADDLIRYADDNHVPVLGRIPYSDAVMTAVVRGVSLLDVPGVAPAVREAWDALCHWQGLAETKIYGT